MARNDVRSRDARRLMLSALDAPDGGGPRDLVGGRDAIASARGDADLHRREHRSATPSPAQSPERALLDGVQLPNYGAGGVQAPRRQAIGTGINYPRRPAARSLS
ncbi:MAG: hypothetical protein KIS83_13620 [Rubrivivax sp.]|nr:hypothetical protein [Rubrivivax sp.]